MIYSWGPYGGDEDAGVDPSFGDNGDETVW